MTVNPAITKVVVNRKLERNEYHFTS